MSIAPERPAFGGLLKRLRAEAGLTQEELAEAAGISARSVSDLERGVAVNPRRETVRILADGLGLAGGLRAAFVAAGRRGGLAAVVPLPGTGAAVPGPESGAPEPPPGTGNWGPAARALPRDVASFAGRKAELCRLTAPVTERGGVVSIHVIGGMPGVGKTAVAVHAAHLLAPDFPDGQVFLPLHGHTPGRRPVDPEDALASLLQLSGVAPGRIPTGLAARTALWRTRVAGRRLLLVLDDATGHEQVRPLLPGTAGSKVLISSRRRLTALEDAQPVVLDAMAPDEACRLLVMVTGRPGLDPGHPAVTELAQLCGHLPLAIGIMARQLRHHPAWTAAELAGELSTARDRLDLMRAEDVSVVTALDLSYQNLAPGPQRLFRLLGRHAKAVVDEHGAACLDGGDLAATRRGLHVLYDHHLLAEIARGRYRLHELVSAYARTKVA